VPAANCFDCPLGYTYPACTSTFPHGQVPCLHAAERLIRNLGPAIVSRDIAEFFAGYRWMVGGTHAGNPIAAAAAVAAIEVYRDEG
jgi:hypothetical protein